MRRLLGAALALTVAGAASAQSSIPVMVGTSGPDLDGCHSVGAVVGLDPRGDNFLAVRAGPSSDFTKIDEVYTNDSLWLCEKRGRWWGVVYAPGGELTDCGVASPLPSPEPYFGTCRSGWVFDRYVDMIAG